MKIKLLRILSICLVLSITSMGVAFGESKEDLDEPVSIQITALDEEVYEAQAEIDKILFEQNNAKDLEAKGIFVTHTSTSGDYVEVGITPYTPENADLVIRLLGENNVKVVEGLKAEILQYSPEYNESTDPAHFADDSQIVEVTGDDEDISALADADVVEDAVTVSAPAEKEEKNGISTLTILGVIGLGLLGGLMVFKKKRA
jgi:hypothetical protein